MTAHQTSGNKLIEPMVHEAQQALRAHLAGKPFLTDELYLFVRNTLESYYRLLDPSTTLELVNDTFLICLGNKENTSFHHALQVFQEKMSSNCKVNKAIDDCILSFINDSDNQRIKKMKLGMIEKLTATTDLGRDFKTFKENFGSTLNDVKSENFKSVPASIADIAGITLLLMVAFILVLIVFEPFLLIDAICSFFNKINDKIQDIKAIYNPLNQFEKELMTILNIKTPKTTQNASLFGCFFAQKAEAANTTEPMAYREVP